LRRVFAGRARELGILTDELGRACAGELRVVLLTGEAGIGKTALAGELVTRTDEDTLVVTARAHGFGTSTPFGLWVEALERHLRTLDAPAVLRLAGLAAPELSPLLRSVEACRPGAARQASSYRLVESFVGLIAAVATRQPTVAVLDDVHLADAASWETLHFLARDRPALPMLVVATARPGELADHPIANDVGFALEQDGLLRRLRLGPLDHDEIAELARQRSGRDVVPAGLVDWLESRSRGNALYAAGLLGALLDEGGDLNDPALAAVPEELGERVRARMRELDHDARETLEVLAVVGARTELADLTRIAGRAVDAVAVALESLARRGLVVEDASGPAPTFELAHPLVQDAICESIGVARRIRLHRAIGRTLLASGDLASAAEHLARSASPGDPEAVGALIGVLQQAEERSLYRDITAILGELLRLLPAGDERWLDVLRVMDPAAEWVLAHLAEDGVADACEAMRRIEPLAEASGDARLRAIVQLRLGCFGGMGLGQFDEALRACELAGDLFDRAGESALAIGARVETAFVFTMQGNHDAALVGARSLREAAEALGDARVTLHLMVHLSLQLSLVGEFEEAAEMEQRGMALADDIGNHYRYALLRNRHRFGLAIMGRVGEARTLAAGTWASPAAADAFANECAIVVDWLVGDLEGALRALAKARVRNRTGVSLRQAQFLAYGARAALDADRLDGVEELVRRVAAVHEGVSGVMAALPAWVGGVLGWRLGRARAVDDLVRAAERLRTLGAPSETLFCLLDVADAASERAAVDVGRWAAAEASIVARAVARFPFHVALEHLVHAIADSDAERARLAVATFDELGYRLFLGRAQLARGRALARSDRDGAVAVLEDAVATLQACGAAWHESRTLDVLRGAGHRGRRAAAAAVGPTGLSPREREVARLAAVGKTAREIAESMFIGERTVETHLQNAYAKLGVGSKRELVQRAVELGLRT
jgi:DNA-binding CsgD family transcriptional regulator